MKEVERKEDAFFMHQTPYASIIVPLHKEFSSDELETLQGKIAYAAASTRPDVSYITAHLAQVGAQNAERKDRKLLNEAVNRLHEKRGLSFRKMVQTFTSIVGYSDGIFAGNGDISWNDCFACREEMTQRVLFIMHVGNARVLLDLFSQLKCMHYQLVWIMIWHWVVTGILK